MVPEQPLVERFRRDLDALAAPDSRIGIAVSGGPDSLALLLLAASARPSRVEAATVDHALRPGSRAEAEQVAEICRRLGVPHATLTAAWKEWPETAIQERARSVRYRLLGDWAGERGLDAIVTAHHLDDQAETVLMRLARGAGVRGLAGMRAESVAPGTTVPLLRPLLGWSHAELERLCASAGIDPVRDPSNEDARFERVRIRNALGSIAELDPSAIAESAAHLGDADAALDWAADREWQRAVSDSDAAIVYDPSGTPSEIRRRIVSRIILALAAEGEAAELRGRELDRVIAALATGRAATLRGVLCTGGSEWRFTPAPTRRVGASAEIRPVEG